jgi:hypothetical protein
LVFLVLLCTYELQKLLNPFFERLMGT